MHTLQCHLRHGSLRGCRPMVTVAAEARFDQVGNTVACLIDTLERCRPYPPCADSLRDDMLIALTEAFNNVVEHAYAGPHPLRHGRVAPIVSGLWLHGGRAFVGIADYGRPLPRQLVRPRATAAPPEVDIPEVGIPEVDVSGGGAPDLDTLDLDTLDLDTLDLDSLAEGGFGWNLIHDCCDRLEYARVGAWNLLCFEKRLDPRGEG
ncbi:MAG: ATP-binding protein [Pseudomonadota bacterium]